MKTRSMFWDNMKGLLIVLVVFGHFVSEWAAAMPGSFVHSAYNFIYLFHMPAFVFCAGFWSNSTSAESKKGIVKLLLCYFACNTLMMLYYYGFQGVSMRLFTPYASCWFLLSLVFWRLVTKHLVHIKGIVLFALAGALLIGFWSDASNFLSIMRTVAFFPFFLLGYKLNTEKTGKFIENRPRWMMVVGWIVALAGAAVLFLLVRRLNLTEAMLTMQPYTGGTDMIRRAGILCAAAVAIAAMIVVIPNVRIPLLSTIGKNSLLIYLVHRFVAVAFCKLLPASGYSRIYLIYAGLATVVTVIVLGLEPVNKVFNKCLNWLVEATTVHATRTGRIVTACILVLALLLTSVPLQNIILDRLQKEPAQQPVDVQALTEDAVKVSFVGDLILLKEQVESAYNEENDSYDFSEMFRFVSGYLNEADLAIGVFEGPMAGGEGGYSTSNFDDGYKFVLNYPDSFATAVKASGIDLVTTANNHVTDMGVEAAYRTLDVLDQAGLQHTGSYRNQQEKDQTLVVDVQGINIAVLSYTFWVSNFTPQQLHEQHPYLTSWIPADDHPYYDQILKEVEGDFAAAKASGADLILVLPHMGTQFSHETDEMQKKWNKIYADLGADIILGDHAHAVQPIEYVGDTLVVNCPGNFANSYISYDGDACAIAEVYIDRREKKPVAASVVPLYTQEMEKGYYRALPVYDIFSSRALYEQLPSRDLERSKEVHSIVTEVMVGREIPIDRIQPRYYWANGQYQPFTEGYADYSDKQVYKLIRDAKSMVFLGDSITQGSRNGGHPWYEPLVSSFDEKEITNISMDSYTTQMISQRFADDISQTRAELYVVAIGTNDIRYRRDDICAMTAGDYVARIDELATQILTASPNAKILFLPPWLTLENDSVSVPGHEEKLEMIRDYTEALRVYTEEKGFYFADPNPWLIEFFREHHHNLYTRDGIHPNAQKGTRLYCTAVLESSQ